MTRSPRERTAARTAFRLEVTAGSSRATLSDRCGEICGLDLVVRPEDAPALAAGGCQMLLWNHDVILVGDFYEDICVRTKAAMAESASEPA